MRYLCHPVSRLNIYLLILNENLYVEVPSASLFVASTILRSINLTDVDISIFYTIEWLMDRFRTSVNSYSHNLCTIMLNKIATRYDNHQIFKSEEIHKKCKLITWICAKCNKNRSQSIIITE